MMLWAVPAALKRQDLGGPVRTGGIVHRVLEAAKKWSKSRENFCQVTMRLDGRFSLHQLDRLFLARTQFNKSHRGLQQATSIEHTPPSE